MIRHISLRIINQIVCFLRFRCIWWKVSTAIRNYGGHAQWAIKMSRILSHSVTAWNNYIPAFLTVIYVKAKRRRMWIFCLLPVGVCIDGYMTICSCVLCVSTHAWNWRNCPKCTSLWMLQSLSNYLKWDLSQHPTRNNFEYSHKVHFS